MSLILSAYNNFCFTLLAETLAKRRRPGQLSWLESQAGGEAKEGGKKGDLERGVRESFGRSGVPRG